MPIKPENKARYPKDWKQIRERILERAGHQCEKCGTPNHWYIVRDGKGWFCVGFNERLAMVWPAPDMIFEYRADCTEIVLTIAHLDHTPENCTDDNLRAWCQRCHLAYDHEHHQRNARETRRNRRAVGDLFAQVAL